MKHSYFPAENYLLTRSKALHGFYITCIKSKMKVNFPKRIHFKLYMCHGLLHTARYISDKILCIASYTSYIFISFTVSETKQEIGTIYLNF